jgi:hypothetical protein
LIVIFGLFSRIESRFHVRCYAGILEDKIGYNLFWYAKEEGLKMYEDFYTPSWSWAAYCGSVRFYLPHYSGNPKPVIFVIYYDVQNTYPKLCGGQNCYSGILFFFSFLGVGYLGGLVRDEGESNESLFPILDYVVNRGEIQMPRISLNGHIHFPKR